MDIDYPDYPCVALRGKVKNTVNAADGSKQIVSDEIMFYPLNGIDDMSHVDHCRKRKGYAVVGYANLEMIVERAKYKANEVRLMKQELDGLVMSPEMKWASRDVAPVEEVPSLESRAKRAKRAGATTLGDLVS